MRRAGEVELVDGVGGERHQQDPSSPATSSTSFAGASWTAVTVPGGRPPTSTSQPTRSRTKNVSGVGQRRDAVLRDPDGRRR